MNLDNIHSPRYNLHTLSSATRTLEATPLDPERPEEPTPEARGVEGAVWPGVWRGLSSKEAGEEKLTPLALVIISP